ncbi:hypothetical protein [Bathymodiolus thermophilus thioautotrophic gill symbiont]|uniref:hypothetical protein n=1 Tax=Bathymodiolus thermophilus thioautotrophic gill symbiont TaxID=2360 RepID=UPI00130158BE|nr:hypothetical protein [Bathymodiolus thermophilus thioautotrophic gill symbiont]
MKLTTISSLKQNDLEFANIIVGYNNLNRKIETVVKVNQKDPSRNPQMGRWILPSQVH